MKLGLAITLSLTSLTSAGSFAAEVSVENSESRPPNGLWAYTGGDGCEIKFEVTADSRIVRTSGSLVYSTRAGFRSFDRGWQIDESLLTTNAGTNCRGDDAAEATKDYAYKKAYIELRGDTLYYHADHDAGRWIEMKQQS